MPEFAYAYDSALASANTGDISIGRSTTRVDDFVNRGPEFDRLYTFGPLLAAGCRVIRQPFKLSTMHARDVRPHSKAQDLHVDFPRDEAGWPMVGFIRSICWISKIEDSAGWNEDRITGFTRIFKKEKENKVMARQLDFPIV